MAHSQWVSRPPTFPDAICPGLNRGLSDIAIAMLENGCAFHAAYPAGNNKPDDAAELGVYRNNWHMIREYCDHFQGAGPSEWQSRGQELQ